MKKILTVLFALLSLSAWSWAGTAKEDATDRLDLATKTLSQIMDAPDKGIPEEVMDGAKCVAVVPHMLKGGFVFGGNHGKGVATCRTSTTDKTQWSAPAFFTISGGSWGAQIGVEGVDLVLLAMNDEGMKNMLAEKFKVGADASAAAGPIGRHAEAGMDWKANTALLTYSRAKGLFAGITLNGAWVRSDADSTRAMYGDNVSYKSVLTGKVPAPPAASAFLQEVRGAKRQAAIEQRKKE